MKNPLDVFKRPRIRAVTIHDVSAASSTNPEVSLLAERFGMRMLHKAAEAAFVSSQIRDELAAGALLEVRGRRR